MGRSYYVPRSAKGETRILYIFTIKSFLTTLVCGGLGALLIFMIKSFIDMSIFTVIICIVPFAGIGFAIGAFTIPDVPIMGPLQKAGGENVLDIAFRLLSFRGKKKIYVYGIDRKIDTNRKNKILNNPITQAKERED